MANQKLTIDEVKHVAKLANLPLTEAEILKLQPQLESVIDLVSKLEAVNTKGVLQTSQVTGQHNVMREDEIDTTRGLTQEEALSNAPRKHKGFFVASNVFNT